MDREHLKKLLTDVKSGAVDIEKAISTLTLLPFEDLGYAKVDHHRALRKGFPEVVLGQGKTPVQIEGIVNSLARNGSTILVTRTTEDVYDRLAGHHDACQYHSAAGMVVINMPSKAKFDVQVAVVSAGTSDQAVAEEAALTARALGCKVELVQDIGISGIHRLFAYLELLKSAGVVVVVAGMDGALPSAVAGLINTPVVAVPTSTGYGASFGGISALLTMLNSCASGVTVVNIDNGFGAGYFAGLVARKLAE
jgi:NCAIR mutase (PurE)-related protein